LASINVTIQEVNGRKTPAALPDDETVADLVPVLVSRLGLPTRQGGNPIHYVLDHLASGKRLLGTQTLAVVEVKQGDTLLLLGEPRAGASKPACEEQIRARQQSYQDRL
jgi:hypothetical protein